MIALLVSLFSVEKLWSNHDNRAKTPFPMCEHICLRFTTNIRTPPNTLLKKRRSSKPIPTFNGKYAIETKHDELRNVTSQPVLWLGLVRIGKTKQSHESLTKRKLLQVV